MTLHTPEQDALSQYIDLILEMDGIVRTQVLYRAIAIEGTLDRIIAWYFCPDEAKHAGFFSLIFREGEMTFASKIRILRKIFKAAYPPLAKLFPKVFKVLDELRELRNKFAHCEVVIPEELSHVDLGQLKLRYFKDNKEVIEPISIESVNERIATYLSWHKVLVLYEVLVRQKTLGTKDSEADAAAAQLWEILTETYSEPA
jgi:hypothetical protein